MMPFRLLYSGPLRSQGACYRREHKHELRKQFHRQLSNLAASYEFKFINDFAEPKDYGSVGHYSGSKQKVKDYEFIPIITDKLHLFASLEILILRPADPRGHLFHGGDIDNRLKTLLDSLRIPIANELPDDTCPSEDEVPFFVLLDDDRLVTSLTVTTDRLLQPTLEPDHVHVVIKVIPENSSGVIMTRIKTETKGSL